LAVDEILRWPPAIWTARAFIVIVVGGGSWTVGLYLARFLRPKHFWKLITGELPKFKVVSGTMKVLGQELAGHATLDTVRDREIEALGQRLGRVEEQVRKLIGIGTNVLDRNETAEEGHDERNRTGEGTAGRAPSEPA
jgi:hypothetical protein